MAGQIQQVANARPGMERQQSQQLTQFHHGSVGYLPVTTDVSITQRPPLDTVPAYRGGWRCRAPSALVGDDEVDHDGFDETRDAMSAPPIPDDPSGPGDPMPDGMPEDPIPGDPMPGEPMPGAPSPQDPFGDPPQPNPGLPAPPILP
ncbi:MAG: hypothetical protein H0V10_00365 [Geodermatophilaceae bacterium]|nr:hypothetical protein [Geodermatophilaceae bacterium]